MAGYYYGQLSKEKKAVYDMLAAGCDALAAVIRGPDLGTEGLSDIYLRMKLDLPLLFFVTGFHYRKMPGADHVEVLPDYLFDRGKVKMHRQAVTARLERLARPLKGKSDREKELAIHDFILENVTYDKLKKSYSHEIIGPLTQGVGVCEGIAKTVKALCDAVGLPCIVALSEAAPEIGVRYRHTWNVVTVEGQRYHVDATFDNSLQRGMKRYDYFNLDDKKIFRDHEPILTHAPACTQGDRFFYREQKLSFTKQEEVGRRALQAIRKKKPLIFHWRGGYLTRDVLGELVALLERTAQEKELHAQVKVNWPQAVLQVSFVPQPPGSALTPQQANEGEDAPAPLGDPLSPL